MKRASRFVVGAVICAAVGCGGEEDNKLPQPIDEADLPESAAQQIDSLLAEKGQRTRAQKKISSSLLYAKQGRFTGKLRPANDRDAQGRVLVEIRGDAAAVSAAVATAGGSVVGSSGVHRSVRAWVSLDKLEDLASRGDVQAIRQAPKADTQVASVPGAKRRVGTHEERVAAMQRALEATRPAGAAFAPAPHSITGPGAALSQGVRAHGADKAHKYYGTTGAGVTVGVLSDSNDFLEESIASGDLPASTQTIPGQDGRPGSGEGTAMMEIVHDMAPDANLVFASAFNGPEQFAQNIRDLRFVYHADIIVDDVIYFFESPYQDDIVAQAVADVVADGAQYFSSAGNGGNYADGTTGTWEGDFKPAGTLATLPSGYTVHNFGNKVISNRIEKTAGRVFLHWSDPATYTNPMASNDYDLFLLDADLRNVLAASTDLQDGAGWAFEYIEGPIPAGARVVVAKHPEAEIRGIRLHAYRGELGIGTGGSTWGHSAASGAFGVAAVRASEGFGAEFTAGPTTPVELFSSDGTRRIFYDRDGNPLKGGVTFASGGGELRQKPDIAAADGVSTTLPPATGLNPFYGTSAAAPHAGAVAALLKSAVPSLTPAQLRNILLTTALDIEAAGVDQDSGRGLVMAMPALKRANAPTIAYLDVNTLTPSAPLLPGASATLRVQLVNNGGARATGISATLSSTTPGVTVTTATSAYPNIASGATGTNPTAFAISVSPTVLCGTQLAFTLTVSHASPGAHPMVLSFALPTGQPSPFPTTFSYTGAPVAIPDGDGTTVSVPLALPETGAISKVVFHLDGAACTTEEGATTVGLDHTWASDVTLALTSPSGTTIDLIAGAGGDSNDANNFCQTYLDDEGWMSIQDVTPDMAPFTGFFRPAQPLSSFAGESGAGTWTLTASDAVPQDTGSVRAFGIDVYGYSCSP